MFDLIKVASERVWETLVRWRTWIVNTVLAVVTIAPEILNAPEVLAVVPHEYQRYFLAGLFVLNILMRPRPAAVKSDPEVQVREAIKNADNAVVTVSTPNTQQVINA